MEHFDVAVIGGGLLGCFAARNLRRMALSVVLAERREDLCTGISRANTAIVYPGYDHRPGSLKAELCVRANRDFETLCRELDVPFSRCGSLMISCDGMAEARLLQKYRQGLENGVPGLQLLDRDALLETEPGLGPGVCSALYAPTAGTVNPWELGIAACENAVQNGAQLRLNTAVINILRADGGYIIETDQGEIACRAVVNCAGMDAHRVQELLFPPSVRIRPTAGDYLVLDKALDALPRHILQFEPAEGSKGLTAVPTVEGSLLLGPSERENHRDRAVESEGLRFVKDSAARLLPGLDLDGVIRSFAALRPNPCLPNRGSIKDFALLHPAPGFWSFIGIKTPGMTCADKLGLYVAEELAKELAAGNNPDFDPCRPGPVRPCTFSTEARRRLVENDPDQGEILCRCEGVTVGQVLEAIRRGAVTVDGVKRRTGACMGRCQGSRCSFAIEKLLEEARHGAR